MEEDGQSNLEEQTWAQAGYQHPGSGYRVSDVVAVLAALRDEVSALEAELQKVETELLGDPDNRVYNRKFERLLEEKRNKEARRERLELQLTAPAEVVYSGAQQPTGILPHQMELQHPLLYLHASLKRPRSEDSQAAEYTSYMNGLPEGIAPSLGMPPKGTGRGGKGGGKFCKRCRERMAYGHQAKCRYCRKCFDESKTLVLRSECPHNHEGDNPTAGQHLLMGSAPLEEQQAALQAQQHELQLRMHAAAQAGADGGHSQEHELSQPHALESTSIEEAAQLTDHQPGLEASHGLHSFPEQHVAPGSLLLSHHHQPPPDPGSEMFGGGQLHGHFEEAEAPKATPSDFKGSPRSSRQSQQTPSDRLQ